MKISIKRTSITKVLWLLSLSVLLVRCSKEEELNTPLTKPLDETLPDKTPIEKEVKRIYDQYGALIEHNYDRNAFSSGATANPVKEKDIIPYIKILEELFFKALNQATGSDKYVKKQLPIKIYLIGNAISYGGKFGKEGTAGQAGNIQPNRLTLGGVSDVGVLLRYGTDQEFLDHVLKYDVTSSPGEGGLAAFVYHEYTHYMDAKHDIPKGFEQPAFNHYLRGTNKYKDVYNSSAREQGFMLPYGMQNEAEDFATYVQIMTWKPRQEIEETILINKGIEGLYKAVQRYKKGEISQEEYSKIIDTLQVEFEHTTIEKSSTYDEIKKRYDEMKKNFEATKEKYQLVYSYYKNFGLDLFKVQQILHSDELKERLLAIKHQYDGTDGGNTNKNARKKVENYFSTRKKHSCIMGKLFLKDITDEKELLKNKRR